MVRLPDTVPVWRDWLPPTFERLWVVEAPRDHLMETVRRLRLDTPTILTASEGLPDPGRAGLSSPVTVRRQEPQALVSQTVAHDLVLWAAGTPAEEAAWADIFTALYDKGCFVLHWVYPDPAVLTLYDAYLIREVPGLLERFVLGWDPAGL